MSLVETKKKFLELLDDADNKVVALSGKWGTGKTDLWGEVVAASRDENVKGSIYASLFGWSNTDQVKRK
jgi:predicted ribonuclease YlaK